MLYPTELRTEKNTHFGPTHKKSPSTDELCWTIAAGKLVWVASTVSTLHMLPLDSVGRSTRIRTLDPLVPNQVRYQTAPHSAKVQLYQAACSL